MNRISLNAGWQFIKLPRGIPVERENLDWETVSLPHTWYRGRILTTVLCSIAER